MNDEEAVSDEETLLEQRLEHESITRCLQNSSMSSGRILSKTLVVVIVAAVMWSMNDHRLVLAWVSLMVSGIVAHDFMARQFGRQQAILAELPRWKNRLLASRLYFGVLWGLAVLVFSSHDSAEHHLFLSTVALMLSFGSVVLGVHRVSMFYLYAGPIMLALLVQFVLQWTPVYGALALFVWWSFFSSLAFTRNLYNDMRSQMRLRLQSTDLAEVLQLSNEEAKRGIVEKSRLLAAASHDLRQPLHAVQLFMSVFKDAVTEAERARVFERIEVSVNSLTRLFDSILDMSRLDADAVKPEWSHFDVSALIEDLKDEFSVMAEEKGLSLRAHAGTLIVKSDRELLERVLRNLISNAIRYTDTGGVLISARRRGHRVLLQVWDTGIGVAPEDKKKIYTEFQQLHTVRDDRVQGFGLGLALVRRFCQLLGYTMTLESTPLRGSVFALSVDEGDIGMMAQEIPVQQAVRWDLTGRCILVIDDEPQILDAMHTILSRWGCEVVTADSLEHAFEQLDRRHAIPEMVLSDMRLRDSKTGIEAIDGIRERYGAQIPGALITGESEASRIALSEQSGYEVLQKPVQPAHIRTTIFRHLTAL